MRKPVGNCSGGFFHYATIQSATASFTRLKDARRCSGRKASLGGERRRARRQRRNVHVIGCKTLPGALGHDFIGVLQVVAEPFGIEERCDITLLLEMRLVFGDPPGILSQFDGHILIGLQVGRDEVGQVDGPEQALADS